LKLFSESGEEMAEDKNKSFRIIIISFSITLFLFLIGLGIYVYMHTGNFPAYLLAILPAVLLPLFIILVNKKKAQ